MKIFVGTLYCGENEYSECLLSIQKQTYRNYEHFIFKDLPNKLAHATLFQTFLDRAFEFDILIKVDADMVICSDQLFEKIVEKMSSNPDLGIFTIAVHDFFTGQMINGLATYRNSIRWNFEKDTLFVDIPEESTQMSCFDSKELAPAAYHCKDPSLYQAFHYGVHRGLKSIARIHSTTHWRFLTKVWENYQRTGDPRIGLAVLLTELVYAGKFKAPDVDYANPKIKKTFEKYQYWDNEKILREIRRLRLLNWGVLPGDLRRKWIRKIRAFGEAKN